MDLIHSLFYEQSGLHRESQIQIMSLSDGFYVLFSDMAKKCVRSLCRMRVPLWQIIEALKESFIENFHETIRKCLCSAAKIIKSKEINDRWVNMASDKKNLLFPY